MNRNHIDNIGTAHEKVSLNFANLFQSKDVDDTRRTDIDPKSSNQLSWKKSLID